MNKKQLIALWLGISVIVLISLFPPTEITFLKGKDKEIFKDISFSYLEGKGLDIFQHTIRPVFLFSTIEGEKEIHYGSMIICQSIVSLITIGLIVTFNKKKAR